MRIKVIELANEKTAITKKIMHSLPVWFSPPVGIENHAVTHRTYPFFAAYDGDMPIGFIALKIHNCFTVDIYNIGILESYHRQGIGSRLIKAAERYCQENNYLYLTVKTLDSSADYEPYERTRAFYQKMGFIPLEVFTTFWDEENPCLFMAKYLHHNKLPDYDPYTVRVTDLGELKTYQFVVIFARYRDNWLYCRAKERDTYETAGGHIEEGETTLDAAKRELYEETGATQFHIVPAFDYTVYRSTGFSNGQVFLAQIHELGDLSGYEMAEVKLFDTIPDKMRFPMILPILFEKVVSLDFTKIVDN